MTPAVPKPEPRKKKAPKRPKARNVKRHKADWPRKYGSKERVEFVKSLPCIACGVVGFSEVAHVGNGGAGRKADAKCTVPLCGNRAQMTTYTDPIYHGNAITVPTAFQEGCHQESHRIGIQTFAKKYQLDLPALAEETDRAWQAHLESQGT